MSAPWMAYYPQQQQQQLYQQPPPAQRHIAAGENVPLASNTPASMDEAAMASRAYGELRDLVQRNPGVFDQAVVDDYNNCRNTGNALQVKLSGIGNFDMSELLTTLMNKFGVNATARLQRAAVGGASSFTVTVPYDRYRLSGPAKSRVRRVIDEVFSVGNILHVLVVLVLALAFSLLVFEGTYEGKMRKLQTVGNFLLSLLPGKTIVVGAGGLPPAGGAAAPPPVPQPPAGPR